MKKTLIALALVGLAGCTTAKVAMETFVGSPSFDVLVAEALANDGKVSNTTIKGAAKILAAYCKVSPGARTQIRAAVNAEIKVSGGTAQVTLDCGTATPITPAQ